MPVKNRFAELLPEITAWRHDLHEHPEILFETHRTSAFVADKLREFGCDEVVTGIGRTGVVGVIKQIRHIGAGHWPACRYGRAADIGSNRAGIRVQNTGRDACLRPRWAYRDVVRGGEILVGNP